LNQGADKEEKKIVSSRYKQSKQKNGATHHPSIGLSKAPRSITHIQNPKNTKTSGYGTLEVMHPTPQAYHDTARTNRDTFFISPVFAIIFVPFAKKSMTRRPCWICLCSIVELKSEFQTALPILNYGNHHCPMVNTNSNQSNR
jgi:hypothetical protein